MKASRGLIIGGGIGGLTLAGFLKQSGHDVTLVERAPALRPVGAGILLHVNTMRVLDTLGARGELEARGVVLRGAVVTDDRGADLMRSDYSGEASRRDVTLGIHRADLHASLLHHAAGADVRLGASPASLQDRGGSVGVRFDDGRSETFDWVVGADGLNSWTRQQIFHGIATRYSGYACWRFVAPLAQGLPTDQVFEMLGPGQRIGYVPIRKDMYYAFLVADAPESDPAAARATADEVRRRFAGFGGIATTVLEGLTDSSALIYNKLSDVWAEEWSRGNVALLGDAAHGVTPNLGQGAAMAIEDAKALQLAFDTRNTVRDVFGFYEELRKERVRTIHRVSYDVGRINQWTNRAAVLLRNTLYRLAPAETSKRRMQALLAGGTTTESLLGHRPDLPGLTARGGDLVRLLLRVSIADGKTTPQEESFVRAALVQRGEHVTDEDVQRLRREAETTSLELLLAPFRRLPQPERSLVLRAAVLMANVDGVVRAELAVLREIADTLSLPRADVEAVMVEVR